STTHGIGSSPAGSGRRCAFALTQRRLRPMRLILALVAIGAATTLAVSGSSRAASGEPPLIGATFTHTSLVGCDLDQTAIVLHYDSPGVRRLVQSQLAAMHAAGLQTIRILLWHMTDITGHDWGVLPSAGGKPVEP